MIQFLAVEKSMKNVMMKKEHSKFEFLFKKRKYLVKFSFFRAMRNLQLKIFSEVFAKAHKMEKLINQCQVVKDFKAKEGNFSAWRTIKCEQEVAVNTTEQ